jgi:hypothetical protein
MFYVQLRAAAGAEIVGLDRDPEVPQDDVAHIRERHAIGPGEKAAPSETDEANQVTTHR